MVLLLFVFFFFLEGGGDGEWTKIQNKLNFPLKKIGLLAMPRKMATNQCALTFL